MFKSIRRRRRLRQYRKHVETNLWFLLNLEEAQFQRILQAFPGIASAVEAAFDAGTVVDKISVEIAGVVVPELLFTLPETKRNAILGILRAGQDVAPVEATVRLWARAIRSLYAGSDRMVDAEKIGPELRDRVMAEVVGALQGYDAVERGKRRILGYLEKAMFPERSEAK